MKHIFDVDIAKEHGVNEAIILESMNYWIQKTKLMANTSMKANIGLTTVLLI